MSDYKIILKEFESKFNNQLNIANHNYRPIAANDKYIVFNLSTSEILLNKADGSEIIIKLENENIVDLEFSPCNNNILAALNLNNTISMNDLSKYDENEKQIKPKCILNHNDNVVSMNFNPVKPNFLCSCVKEGKAYIWDIDSGNIISEINIENNPTGLSWSPNGELIGICFENGLLNIYNVDNRNNKMILSEKISQKNISSRCFSWISDNSFISVGSREDNTKNLSIWDNFISSEKSILGECSIYSIKINDNNSDIVPIFNRDRNLIYLVNKQDVLNPSIPPFPSITVYEFKDKQIIKKSEYFSSHSSNFAILISNNFFNKEENEIDRFIRYCSDENKMYFVSIFQELEKENINNISAQKAVENHSDSQNDEVSRKNFVNQIPNNSFKANDLTKSLESFVEIYPQVSLDNIVGKKDDEIKTLKLELENQKKIIEDLNKENAELKLNSKENDKDKEINGYKETIANLKKNIEDIKNEKINIIKEQITNLEDKKKRIEEEIEKLNKALDYKNEENENNIKPENNLVNDETPINITFNELNDNLKNEQGKSVKLDRIVKKTGLMEQIINSDADNVQNKDYVFYNLNIIDDKKDIVISNGDEYKVFKIESNSNTQ